MRRRLRRWAFGAALCCAATLTLLVSASAQDVTRAHLLTVPDATALSDHFPPVALATGVSGRVVLSCAIALDGSSECSAAEETPANAGFGAAAVTLAQDWRFSPRVEGGQAVASVSRVPIVFENPSSEALVIERAVLVDRTRGEASALSSQDADRVDDYNPQSIDEENTIAVTGCRGGGPCGRQPRTQTDGHTRHYPVSAHAANANGRALIACAVRSDGRVECGVEREAPQSLGFGEAGVALVSELVSRSSHHLPAGSVFRVPVDFALHDPGEPPALRIYFQPRPSPSRQRFYPSRALERGIDGRATLICAVIADGTFNCGVGSETPAGMGFGASAQRIYEGMRLEPAALGLPGLAPGDRFRIPVTFRLG